MDNTRKLWNLLLSEFKLLLPKIYYWKGDWSLASSLPNLSFFIHFLVSKYPDSEVICLTNVFVGFLQLCSHRLIFFFASVSRNLVMSWHAPCLQKWGEKTPFFARHRSPPCLNLQTVQPNLLVCKPPPPKKIRFFSEPR